MYIGGLKNIDKLRAAGKIVGSSTEFSL